jgi:hypothetical protein
MRFKTLRAVLSTLLAVSGQNVALVAGTVSIQRQNDRAPRQIHLVSVPAESRGNRLRKPFVADRPGSSPTANRPVTPEVAGSSPVASR